MYNSLKGHRQRVNGMIKHNLKLNCVKPNTQTSTKKNLLAPCLTSVCCLHSTKVKREGREKGARPKLGCGLKKDLEEEEEQKRFGIEEAKIRKWGYKHTYWLNLWKICVLCGINKEMVTVDN